MVPSPRLTCRRSGNGGPQTCLPAACGVAQRGPSAAHPHQHKLKTLARGQASRGGRQGASSSTASSGGFTRRRRGQGGIPREVPMTQAMTTKGASRAPARAVSSFPLWCKGGKRRREHQAKASTSVQQDQDQPNGREEVIVEPQAGVTTRAFDRRGPTLVRISVPAVPLQNGQLLAPFPLNIWEEAQGLCL